MEVSLRSAGQLLERYFLKFPGKEMRPSIPILMCAIDVIYRAYFYLKQNTAKEKLKKEKWRDFCGILL